MKVEANQAVHRDCLIQKLKYGGYADFHDLMISFEDFMQTREVNESRLALLVQFG